MGAEGQLTQFSYHCNPFNVHSKYLSWLQKKWCLLLTRFNSCSMIPKARWGECWGFPWLIQHWRHISLHVSDMYGEGKWGKTPCCSLHVPPGFQPPRNGVQAGDDRDAGAQSSTPRLTQSGSHYKYNLYRLGLASMDRMTDEASHLKMINGSIWYNCIIRVQS